ncbi:MAG: hypothetical protein F6K28_42355, partial [Microcoleus sp. SIO2G3]|nr:hypothetical protein [Microcoleus sp. SIO2G3]
MLPTSPPPISRWVKRRSVQFDRNQIPLAQGCIFLTVFSLSFVWDFLLMDRRVLGSGAIVCSAMVLWSQQSAPDYSKECETEGVTAPCATSPRQAQQAGIVPPSIEQAIASLPLPHWGSQPDD